MKILFGVQGTGNGHISRASAIYEELKAFPDVDVTWLLSGRERERGCGAIKNFEWRQGLTFISENGKINLLKTARQNNLVQFWRDVNSLDLSGYDLLICDYEPVMAHAARKRGLPTVGIGHQYAFRYDIPLRGANPFVKGLMNVFAPTTRSVGLHWHHFGHPILPPILDLHLPVQPFVVHYHKVIVYLPFENLALIRQLFSPWKDHEFWFYHPDALHEDDGHLHLRPISRDGFKQDLLTAGKVITNSGFELISECLQLGKAILTKPLHGQFEQLSNAEAMARLQYATVIDSLQPAPIENWLRNTPPAVTVNYPNVAKALAAWIAGGCRETEQELAAALWK